MNKKYIKDEFFLTNSELEFRDCSVPKYTVFKIVEVNEKDSSYKIRFEVSLNGEPFEQIFYAHEIEGISLSDEEVLSFYKNELKSTQSSMQISEMSETVSNYILKKEQNVKKMFNEYWCEAYLKHEEFQSLSILDKIKKFQNKTILWELTKSEFLEMLQYCNIRIPKACLEVIYVRNDDTMRLTTNHKSQLKAVINAYNKLVNYNF